MKLPTVLYAIIVFLNLLSLGFIIGLFILVGINDFPIDTLDRFTGYLLYVTVLFNLYGLFYIAVRNRFDE